MVSLALTLKTIFQGGLKMLKRRGKLQYSPKDKSWNVFLKNDSTRKFTPDDNLLDIDIKVSNYFVPCALDLKDGSLGFVETSLNLDNCYEYDIILYLPRRDNQHEEIFDVPF